MSEPKLTDARLKELIRIREDEHTVPGPQDEADTLTALKEYRELRKEGT